MAAKIKPAPTMGFSQTPGLAKLNLIRSLCHNKVISAKMGHGVCSACEVETLEESDAIAANTDAFRQLVIERRAEGVEGEVRFEGDHTGGVISTQLVEKCKHNEVPAECKKCIHAAKERARRAAKK